MNIIDNLLPAGSRNRPGTPLRSRTAVVLHWVASANVPASNVANFIRNRQDFGSYNFIIGLQGEIIRIIPVGEVTFNAGTSGRSGPNGIFPNNANEHTASIGMCHDQNGAYNPAQINSLKWLLHELRQQFGFRFLLTHHDVTGKNCDMYYRTRPEELTALAKDCGYKRPA